MCSLCIFNTQLFSSYLGESTIGSRYHSGKVSIFPSYKFNSTTWSLVRYHFRSLDTWLDGVCKSHCEEHPWHSDVLNYLEAAGKRSIFSDAAEEQDISAGGEEQEELQLGGEGATTEESVPACFPCTPADAVDADTTQLDQQQEPVTLEKDEGKPATTNSSKGMRFI